MTNWKSWNFSSNFFRDYFFINFIFCCYFFCISNCNHQPYVRRNSMIPANKSWKQCMQCMIRMFMLTFFFVCLSFVPVLLFVSFVLNIHIAIIFVLIVIQSNEAHKSYLRQSRGAFKIRRYRRDPNQPLKRNHQNESESWLQCIAGNIVIFANNPDPVLVPSNVIDA